MKNFIKTCICVTLITLLPISANAKDIGVLAATNKPVTVMRGDEKLTLHSGDMVQEGDDIYTDDDATLQVLLFDETTFTLAPFSHINILDYEYDELTQEGSLKAVMDLGTVKFSTGNITNGDPKNFEIGVRHGVIGVRGTLGLISVLTPDQAQQQFPDQTPPSAPNQPVVFAALKGPGPTNQTGTRSGSFTFSSPNGSVDLNRPGSAVLATPGQPPVFFIAPPGSIQNINKPFGSGNNNQNSDDANSSSQQENTDANTTPPQNNDNIGNNNGDDNNVVDTPGFNNIVNNPQNFGGTLQELVALNSGEVAGTGGYTGDITGDFAYLIDFSARTFDMQSYNLNGGGLTNAQINLTGGSAALPVDSRTSITIGNNGEDFGADIVGACGACSVTATFPASNAVQAEITNGASTGQTAAITMVPTSAP